VSEITGLAPCHRLDVETSGCLVLARPPEGERALQRAFQAGSVRKEYLAVVVGTLNDEQVVDLPIGEWKRGRVVIGKGRPASTRLTVRWRSDGRVGVLAEPFTGRTHQIRAHLSSLGAPILGDPTYGGPRADRLYLHAWRVCLPWPEERWVEAPIPPGFLP
jgi:23S rRNA-/tRNA-specific pseudouridylate synthase